MFSSELTIGDVQLVKPDIDRDAPLGVKWLASEAGRDTLRKMGVADKDNQPTTLEQERRRVKEFIEKNDQINWMIRTGGKIVGAIWVDIKASEYLQAPSVHIMVGDPAARGQGIGSQAFRAVINWLEKEKKEPVIYSRHLLSNSASANMLKDNNFNKDGPSYRDADGLLWQNVKRN